MAQAYEFLIKLSPHEIYEYLRQVLKAYRVEAKQMIDMENLHSANDFDIGIIEYCQSDTECIRVDDWEKYRKESGMLFRLSRDFYKGVWYLLQQCKGLVIGDKYNIENSISSDVTLESTAGERNFDLKIDSLLQKIEAPEYRQLNVELLESLIKLFENNPEIKIEEELLLDVLIGHAVRIAWIENHWEENYQEFKTQAWEYMYKLSPQQTHEYFIKAFKYLLTTNNSQ
jgi:phosphorylase kinase alpha/beta subunit